jgi:hypothetical protein
MELADLAEQRAEAAERNAPCEKFAVAPAVCKFLFERPVDFEFAEWYGGLFGLSLS